LKTPLRFTSGGILIEPREYLGEYPCRLAVPFHIHDRGPLPFGGLDTNQRGHVKDVVCFANQVLDR
jgi:hypothetical protein